MFGVSAGGGISPTGKFKYFSAIVQNKAATFSAPPAFQ